MHYRTKNRPRTLLRPLLALLLLAACNETGEEILPPVDPGGDPDTFRLARGSLLVVDPLEGDGALTVAEGLAPRGVVLKGELDGMSGVLREVIRSHVVYGSEERLWSLDLVIERDDTGEAEEPRPEELVQLDDPVVVVRVEQDHEDGSLTYLVGTTGGFVVVRHIGSEVSAPEPFPGRPLASLVDPASGAFAGWLGLEDGSLSHVDVELEQTTLMAADSARVVGQTETGDLYLVVDDVLMGFERGTGELFDLGAPEGRLTPLFAVADGELVFALENPVALTTELFHSDLDGPAISLGVEPSAVLAELAIVGDDAIFVIARPSGSEELIRRSLDGGDRTPLAGFQRPIRLPLAGYQLSVDTVFYNVDDVGAFAVPTTGGVAVQRAKATWIAPHLQDDVPLAGRPRVETLLLVDAIGFPALLQLVDPSQPGGVLRSLGEIDPDYEAFVTPPTWEDPQLGSAQDVGNGQSDLFQFDTRSNGSLEQVTQTPDRSETAF